MTVPSSPGDSVPLTELFPLHFFSVPNKTEICKTLFFYGSVVFHQKGMKRGHSDWGALYLEKVGNLERKVLGVGFSLPTQSKTQGGPTKPAVAHDKRP